jgi:elongation factor Ts
MSPAYRVITSYVHNGRIGVLIELGLQTSFTAGIEEFAQLAKDVAVHVAGARPTSLEALLGQPFVKDAALTVAQLLATASDRLGERITVTRFVRWDTEELLGASPTPSDEPAAARLRSVG